jgi:hypothetical protein
MVGNVTLRRSFPFVLAAALLTGSLTGCGSGDGAKPSGRRTTSTPRTSSAPRPTPGPPGAPGQTLTVGGTVDAVVFSYKQPSVTGGASAGPEGYTWGSADVQVCTRNGATATVTVDWETWALRYSDNSIVEAATKTDDAFPQPLYPVKSHQVPAGQCVRGWITFAVPGDKRPTLVEYTPHGYVAQWRTGT